ncbi:MAG: CRISPR-associated endonuclease Cas2 [Candidatus Cloacimonetes bacterium]|nr:CRISPR-associated endonuclease Cas2 [Candidatus Cloacimonadota bacterium]
MHVIAIYDIGEKRVGKVLKKFRKYLTWIQNSVFQGDITKAKLEKLKIELLDIIDADYDSVVFFKFRTEKMFTKEFIGKNFDPFDNVI